MVRLLRVPLRLRTAAVPVSPVLSRCCYSTLAGPLLPTPEPQKQLADHSNRRKSAENNDQPPNIISVAQHRFGFEVPAFYLRDACKCSLCVDQHSKQRKFRSSDIPPDIAPRSLKWENESLEVQWQNDIEGFDESHVSKFTGSELDRPTTHTDHQSADRQRRRFFWNNAKMTRIQHWTSYEDYMNDEVEFTRAMRNLALTGLIFVKNIPDSREMVEKIATRMGPIRNTFYGQTWDVRKVPEAKNVAYTNQFLGFHMDLMYMNEAPGYQLLHCLQNSCDGGESLFADTFKVAGDLRKNDFAKYEHLTQLSLQYEYLHEGHKYRKMRRVFEPFYNPRPGNPIAHVNYSPPFQGPFPRGAYQNPEIRPMMDALKTFAVHLESPEYSFQLKLNPGECVIFENRRVVHARRQFNTNEGERWLAGTYVDEDSLLSTFRVAKARQESVWENTFADESY